MLLIRMFRPKDHFQCASRIIASRDRVQAWLKWDNSCELTVPAIAVKKSPRPSVARLSKPNIRQQNKLNRIEKIQRARFGKIALDDTER